MNLSAVISQLISLFLMIGAGYLSARAGLISPELRPRLSALVLSVTCPCVIISSVLSSSGGGADMPRALLTAIVFFAAMIAMAALLTRLARTPAQESRLDQMMLVLTNLIFMGIPVVQSLYGASGVAMLSMFILVFNFLVYTYGVLMLCKGARLRPRDLLNPGVISALAALLLGLTRLRLPGPVESALSSVGSVTTPLAMMIIGASLAHSDIRAAFTKVRLYRVSLLRLIVMPLCVLAIVRLLPIDTALAGICVVVAAMPIAGNCGMLADVYTPGDMTAAHAIIVSTLLCAATLPLILAVMAVAL